MAYDLGLAERVRECRQVRDDVREKKMFGGLCFMVHGNMCCGVVASELMLRVGPDRYREALTLPHARELDFTGRPMRGMLMVAEEGILEDQQLNDWVNLALNFMDMLPPK